jgi:hypothetical protein
MHTVKIILAGLAVLALCLAVGRGLDGSSVGLARGSLVFIPLWLIAAGVNLWVGVSKAGYSVADEAPVFLLVFAVPAAVATVAWWRFRGS